MIHRAPFGSLERLIGILIEEYAGDFPLWLAPVQVRLLPVRPDHYEYVQEVAAKMRAAGIRAEADTNGDRLGKMVRNAEKQKIPVMSVVGDQEVADNTLSIRTRASGELGAIAIEEVINKLTTAISEHRNF
jgi:threonyl-tRNA synthetase